MKASFFLVVMFVFSINNLTGQTGTWAVKSFDSGTLYDICFVDSLYGWTVGTGGKIFNSTDGGDTWSEQIHVTDNPLNGVQFIDRNLGFAVGYHGTFLKTTNGGISWSVKTTTPSYNWLKVHFANPQLGWIICSLSEVYQTTDGGDSWNVVGSQSGFSDIWFIGETHGWVAGGGGIWNTIDGTNWTNVSQSDLHEAQSVSFIDDSLGYAIRQTSGAINSVIWKTFNGGSKWYSTDTIYNCLPQNIYFLDSLEGWFSGWNNIPDDGLDGGCVYHTVDGGVTWNREVFLDYYNYYSLLYRVFFLNKYHGWAVGGGSSGRIVVKYTVNLPQFSVNPIILSYDSLQIDETHLDSVTVTNTGTDDLIISSVISEDSSYKIQTSQDDTLSPAGSKIYYITFTPKRLGDINSNIIFTHNAGTGRDTVRVSGTAIMKNIYLQLSPGWNMVSVPLDVLDFGKTVLFPNAVSSAFTYEYGYVEKETLINGVGYWIKYPDSQTVQISGFPIMNDTIEVKTGWNMIGSLSYDVPVYQITSLPEDIIISSFWKYQNGYIATGTIVPGKSYWVKVKEDGKIILRH